LIFSETLNLKVAQDLVVTSQVQLVSLIFTCKSQDFNLENHPANFSKAGEAKCNHHHIIAIKANSCQISFISFSEKVFRSQGNKKLAQV